MVEKEREAFAEFFEGKNVKKVLDASCGSGEQTPSSKVRSGSGEQTPSSKVRSGSGEQAIALATPYYLTM